MKPRPVQPVLWILAARRRPSVAAGDDRALGSEQYASMSPGERLHRALELSTFCRLPRNAGDRAGPGTDLIVLNPYSAPQSPQLAGESRRASAERLGSTRIEESPRSPGGSSNSWQAGLRTSLMWPISCIAVALCPSLTGGPPGAGCWICSSAFGKPSMRTVAARTSKDDERHAQVGQETAAGRDSICETLTLHAMLR